jgi:hypothetical protein
VSYIDKYIAGWYGVGVEIYYASLAWVDAKVEVSFGKVSVGVVKSKQVETVAIFLRHKKQWD